MPPLVYILLVLVSFEASRIYTTASSCSGEGCEVPDFLSSTHIDVAASAHGATCTANKGTCSLAFDHSEATEWQANGGVGNYIKVTFARTFTINTLRVMQRGNTVEQNKKIQLDFSGGESITLTLKRNLGTSHTSPSMWEVLPFPEVCASWVKITISTVYASFTNGFRELQFYDRIANKGKHCDRLGLPVGVTSRPQPLFGRTVSLALKSTGTKVILLEGSQPSPKKYTFVIGTGGECTLSKYDGSTNTVKATNSSCTNVVSASGLRSVWIDFRCANVKLGSGTDVILQWKDTDPLDVSHIAFGATAATEAILCHRKNVCYQDADHYWPLDKVSGGEVHDINGGNNGRTNLSSSDFKSFVQAINMFSMGPLIDTKTAGQEKYITLKGLRGQPILDPELGDCTFSFWTLIPTSQTSSVMIMYSRTKSGSRGFTIKFTSTSLLRVFLHTRTQLHQTYINITRGQPYNVVGIWSKKRNTLTVLVNDIQFSASVSNANNSDPSEPYLQIGKTDSHIGKFYFSNFAVWMKELALDELNAKLACSQIGNGDESCSPAEKKPCGSSYTQAQCESIGCCYDGSGCFKRDANGSKATLPSIARASSFASHSSSPNNGMLKYQDAPMIVMGWSPKPSDTKSYLELDTFELHTISDVVVQGSGLANTVGYVESFMVSHSKGCAVFNYIMDGSNKKVFTGNTDSTARVTVSLPTPVSARCIRIKPTKFKGRVTLKAKLLGTRQAKPFHGCFKSGSFVSASGYEASSITPEKCIILCGLVSKTYAALKSGRYCFCGSTVDSGSAVDKAVCNLPCSGNPRLTCGSQHTFSVYSVTSTCPSLFNCPFPSNVTSLTTLSASCTANSRVICDFGESSSVESENAPVKYSYYSVPANFHVVCKGYIDSEGESCVKLLQTSIEVYDDFEAKLKCPSFAERGQVTNCNVQVWKGTGVKVSYQFTGQSVHTDVEMCDAVGVGVGVTFEAPIPGSLEPARASTILLANTRQAGNGRFMGIKVTIERAGCFAVQTLRPVCGSGTRNTYYFTNGNVDIQSDACSSLVTNCTNGQMFGLDVSGCVTNSISINSSVPKNKFEVVTVNQICFTSVGRQKVYFENANISHFKQGDFFALHFPDNGAIKISRRDSASTRRGSVVVTYSLANKGIGTIIVPAGAVAIAVEFSITLLVKGTCEVSIPVTYVARGVFNENVTLTSKSRSEILHGKTIIQDRITMKWHYRPGAVLNEPFVVIVTVLNGSDMSATLRFDNTTVYNTSWVLPVTYNFTHTYTKRQNETISLTIFNGLSMVYEECTIVVQKKVSGLTFTQLISPVTYPHVTFLCFKLTGGDGVSFKVHYGNGLSNSSVGTFDIQDHFIGCFNHSHSVGIYHVNINASNLASEEIISRMVIVEKVIQGLSFIIEQEFAPQHIEVNETICVVSNVTQGTNPTYNVSWGDGEFDIGLQNKVCHSYSKYSMYVVQVFAENNVSRQNISQEIQVHKPVYPLFNFNVDCPPTNHTNPTPCVLTIGGGNDFECTWTFGDGLTSTSNDTHVGQPFYHVYSSIGYFDVHLNCSNRLYNTSLETDAIVEIPMLNLHIGQIPNCAHGQTAIVFVAVDTGSGVNFTVFKENIYTKETVVVVPVFNPANTNGTITFQCQSIGVYCLKATAVNNVTVQQSFIMHFKIDYTIVGATMSRFTDEYMTVGFPSMMGVQMTQGSNVTIFYYFRDGTEILIVFHKDIFPAAGRNVSHVFQIEVDALVNIVVNNSVSEVTFVTPIKSQHPHKDVFLVCSDPQPFPPGTIQCTINNPSGIPTPTNSSCTIDYGNGKKETKALVPPLVFNTSYAAVGEYSINVTCTNDVSSVNLMSSVEVQTPIDNDYTNVTTAGGLYGSRGPGRGQDASYFPTNHSITVEAAWGNGTNVSLDIDWGDSSHCFVMNKTCSHTYMTLGTYSVIIVIKNAVNSKTKAYTLHLQEAVEGFGFTNNGPVALTKPLIFSLSADKFGTSTCFSLNIDNGTSFLYTPSADTVCEPECSYGTTVRHYTAKAVPFNISHVHKYIGNYEIKAVACNIVSRVVVLNLANVSPKPCKYPQVNFSRTEANISRVYPVYYRKSIQFPITPIIKINCEATKLSLRTWGVERCEGEVCAPFYANCSKPLVISNPTLVVPARCFPYGLYRLSCKVEMLGGGTRGIFVQSFGYIKIIKTPLMARIAGGSEKAVGYGNAIAIDGTISMDPDTNSDTGIQYIWFCKEASESSEITHNSTLWPGKPFTLHPDLRYALNQSNSSHDHLLNYSGCFGYGPGRLDTNDHKLSLSSEGMKINHTYVITLMIRKDTRWATTTLSVSIVSGNPPECKIICIAGCGEKINPSDKHGLIVECTCRKCGPLQFHWYLFKRNKTTNEMEELQDFQSMTSTSIDFNNLVVKPNSLQGGSWYSFKITAYDTLNQVKGFTSRHAITNPSPWNGFCNVSPPKGDSNTVFNISCPKWLDDDEYIIFYSNIHDPDTNIDTPMCTMRSDSQSWYTTKLPVGKESRDFNQTVRMKVCDPLLACNIIDIEVKVTLKKKDESEFQAYLTSLFNIEGTMNALLGEARIDELGTFIFNSINNMKLQQESLPSWSDYTVQLITKVVEFSMDVVCKVVSSDSKKASSKASVIGLLLSINTTISDKTKNQGSECLLEAAKDISSFPPSELASAATTMVSTMGVSFIASSTETAGIEFLTPKSPEEIEKEKEKKLQLAQQLMNTAGAITDAFASTMVPGEAVIISTNGMNISVNKVSPKDLEEVTPSSGTSIGGLSNAVSSDSAEPISVKLCATAANPFSSAEGAGDVNSGVIDLNLGNDDGSNMEVKNLSKPIEIFMPAAGAINLTAHEICPGHCNYHVIEVPKNHSSIFVELLPCNNNATFNLFLRRNVRPTRLLHDYNFTLDPNATTPNVTDGKSANIWFLSNEELNRTAAGTWKLAVCLEDNVVFEEESECSCYNISTFTAACMFYNETTKKFSDDGLKVGPKTTRSATHCLAMHATSFASDFFVPPNSIDWSKISLDELLKNPIVFIVVMVIFGLYFLVLIWARRADKKDLDKVGLTPLPDNDPRDHYLYEIVIYTGHGSGSGTTSDVYMILSGGLDETSPRQLCDPEPSRKKFGKGSTDYFLLAVPRSLGKLKQLRIWHNNKGDDPSWFLQRIMVRDLQVDKKTWFVNLRWLAVEEDDGMVERTLHPATKQELTNFGLLFSTEARKNLTDNHLWFSVVARPAKSTFTRVQRLSCCLSIILTTMVANAMFYQVGDESSTGTSVHIGPFSFSIKQLSIAITSSLVVLPVNILVVTIFRKIRPPDPRAKAAAEQDPNNQSDKYKPELDEVTQTVVSDNEEEGDDDEEKVEEEEDQDKIKKSKKKEKKKKKARTLSPKFAYLAYVVIFLASTVSATFTVFYGLTFGKEKSEGWLSSIMISFWQDVLISQPLKVFAAATFFALVIKDPNKGEDENEQNELNPDEELVHKNIQNSEDEKTLKKIGFVAKPPDPEKLEAYRQLKLKQKQMKMILYEIMQYMFFLIVVLIIAYGNRDPMAYGVTKAMDDFFVSSKYSATLTFDSSNIPSAYWKWVEENYIPTLQPQYWYGPLQKINKSNIESIGFEMNTESFVMKGRNASNRWQSTNGNYVKNPRVLFRYPKGFVADHATAYLVGSPRIRQLRIKKNQSTMLPFIGRMISECNADYEWDLEDQESYHAKWEPFAGNDTKDEKSKSPWYYRTAWELKGTPYWGKFASYWGGGFVADLGSDKLQAEEMIANLSKTGWVDRYSRALFAEFTIYNPYTNFFSAVTLLTEIRATGGYHHIPKVQTLRLYRYIGPEMVFVMACEVTYIAFLVYFLYKQVKKYRAERKQYFKDSWNYLEIAVLSFSISSVGLYFARLGMTKLTIRNMKETPDSFVSFQYVAFLDEWVSATCSLAVFFSFLKFLRLLRFNRRMALLSQTLKQASKPLFCFFIYFGVIFLAYALFGYSMFSMSDENYASFHRTIVTLFGMTLGDFDFQALVQANRIFGPLYFFSYVVLILFILMNVFLCIIVDTFDEVNRDVQKQGNDHEMMSFMIHSVKSNIGRKCGPAIKPTYVEEKSPLDKDIDSIEEISDNIQYAFRNMCMEDIRQTKWFDPKKSSKKKKLVIKMLLEDEENFTENDLCDAIPVIDDFTAQHSVEQILRMLLCYREKKQHDESAEDASRVTESSAESDDMDTDFSDDDDYSDVATITRRGSNLHPLPSEHAGRKSP